MCFSNDHPDPELRGKPKGIRATLQERKSMWDKFMTICKVCGAKVVGKCTSCAKSQSQKDAERRMIFAEASGQDGVTFAEDVIVANSAVPLLQTTSGAACSRSSLHRRISKMRNPSSNCTLKTQV